ncbi:MAG: type II secretion system F family protein [Opitutales bacterium]
MPQFTYKARRTDGQFESGELEAPERRQAAERLRSRGLAPITLQEATSGNGSLVGSLIRKAKALQMKPPPSANGSTAEAPRSGNARKEKTGLIFLQRLMELHGSGLPVGDSIHILSQRLSHPEQKQLATALWKDLSEGGALAGALSRQPKYFSSSITFVIEAGEATGNLAPILRKVIAYLEEKQTIRQRMLASMAYPAFICSVAFAVVLLFLFFLLPRVEDILDRLGGEMTWSARILIEGADYLIRFGPFALVLAVVAGVAFNQWRRKEEGRLISDRWMLRIPLIGRIIYYSDLFQSGNLISTLLESGINTTETLRLTERTIRNTDLRERFRSARIQVNEGLSVANAFQRNGFMPELAIDILTVGENTGNLSHSMNEITRGFREELSRRLETLTRVVSSGALVFAFLLVALIALGVVTSVFQVSHTLSN